MKNKLNCTLIKISVISIFFLSFFCLSHTQEIVEKNEEIKKINLSSQSVKLANDLIQRGVNFLTDNQKPDGSWCEHPGITGLVCIALYNSKTTNNLELKENAIKKGRKYMLYFVQKDGSIWMAGKEREFPVYTTSIVLVALATLNNPEDIEIMKNARKFLLNCQLTQNNPEYPTPEDSDSFGGFSYGPDGPPRSDLSNTQWVLEALYMTEHLDKEPYNNNPEVQKKSKLAWSNAVKF
ncbi:MAG TPA: terpene cyclase/mutase family protein, partial [Victivallales bacterium]|nr:terpene cyclase/mutase family protein [Victivallales bacterium]